MRKLVYKHPDALRPHPLNRELYGPPSANTAYHDIKADMKRRGFDESQPLLITTDDRIIRGSTRHAAARANGLERIPCEVFVPADPAQAELEIELALVRGNAYRTKTETMKAREQRKLLEIEKALARGRMSQGKGDDDGPSKSTDRVGKLFGESGKTVQRRLKILTAIETAQQDGDARRATRLGELLDTRQTTKALELIGPRKAKTGKAPPRQVEVPPTFHAHMNRAYSEFFEGCCKAIVPAELDMAEATLKRMQDDLAAARRKLGGAGPT
jgi:ParB-like chromosome segregation protein Spo0J